MLMTLTVSFQMTEESQEIVSKSMMQGFNDMASKAGTSVTGGQTIMNPSPIIGGVAMSVVNEDEFLTPCRSQPGDLILLTKPIGTQIAVNLWEWLGTCPEYLDTFPERPSDEEITRIYHQACESMASLNLNAAKLVMKFQAHACTDVTGFGILGHAENLVSIQHQEVDFVFKTLPVIQGVMKIDKMAPFFKLKEGLSAETSGGLLVVVERDKADLFLKEFKEMQGKEAWIVGEVVCGMRRVVLDGLEILEV
jgi:selenide,water dikinase